MGAMARFPKLLGRSVSGEERREVDWLPVAAEQVAPEEMDVLPGHGRAAGTTRYWVARNLGFWAEAQQLRQADAGAGPLAAWRGSGLRGGVHDCMMTV